MPRTAGLIGAGAVGSALLERLALAGIATSAYDVSAKSREAARSTGTAIAASPAAAVAGADYVHVCVRTDDQAIDALLGTDGALAAMKPGAVLLLHSTVLPETTFRIGAAAAKRGIDLLDATIVGMPPVLRAGDACFLLGGAPESAEAIRPHLLSIQRAVYYFGPLGSGNVAKIVKNLATAVDRVLLGEVVTLAGAGGLDPRSVLEMMRIEFHPHISVWEHAFEAGDGPVVAKPPTNLLDKDLPHALEFSKQLGLNLPLTSAAAETAATWVAAWKNNEIVTITK